MESKSKTDHWADLKLAFKRMRKYNLKMNHPKCAFGVSAKNFLDFLVHERGTKIDKNKAKAIIELLPLKIKIELQSLLKKKKN